jgi:hypothetical protein
LGFGIQGVRKGFRSGIEHGSWLMVDGDFRVPDLPFAAEIGPEDSLCRLFMAL